MEEKKKRINKLMLPLTIKSLSVLGAVTIMATSAGCQSNKNNKKDNSKSSSITSSEGTDYVSGEARIESEIDQTVSSEVDSEGNVIITDPSTGETIIASSDGGKKPSSNNTNGNNGNNGNNGSTNSTKPSQTNPTNPSTQSPSSAVTSTPEFTPSVPNLPSTLTASNINNVEVFKSFSNQFKKEIGSDMISYDGNITNGEVEFQVALALVNYQYMTNDTLQELFGKYSQGELQSKADFAWVIISHTCDKKKKFNFDKYCVDKSLGAFLIDWENSVINNDESGLFDLSNKYYIAKDSKYYYGNTNPWVDYYIYNIVDETVEYWKQPNLQLAFSAAYPSLATYKNQGQVLYEHSHGKVKVK